jgi:uncharacterized protein with HEPN domain
MPPDLEDQAHLADMLASAQLIIEYVRGKSRADYDRDSLLRDGVERRLAIIGEAATRVSTACKDSLAHIAWRKIIASRNIISHAYDEVDSDIVWRIAQEHIPELVTQLAAALPPPPHM